MQTIRINLLLSLLLFSFNLFKISAQEGYPTSSEVITKLGSNYKLVLPDNEYIQISKKPAGYFVGIWNYDQNPKPLKGELFWKSSSRRVS